MCFVCARKSQGREMSGYTVSDWDTRIPVAIADLKAGAAAIDDSRCAIAEILDEGPRLQGRDHLDLERVREALNTQLTKTDAVIGLLSRLEERLK